QMLLRVVFPTVLFNGPAFFFFFVYLLIPLGCGFDFLKHLSIALFDLWIGVYALSLVSLMRLEPIFKGTFERLRLFGRFSSQNVTPLGSTNVRNHSRDEGD
ncbi:hypothetical protein PFISCL1PPCAC_1671, partial [Pristionchus fissidentatus]